MFHLWAHVHKEKIADLDSQHMKSPTVVIALAENQIFTEVHPLSWIRIKV